MKAKNPVQSIERADTILTILKDRDGARLMELEDELRLSKGAIHSYLATLEQCGFVRKEGTTYKIGFKCLDLGGYVREGEPVYQAGREGVDELAIESGELLGIIREWEGRCLWLYQTAGTNAMPMDSRLGARLPMHCTASGKALLAELTEGRVREIVDTHGLTRWTANTVSSQEELFDQLATIRKRGIAFDDEERIDGLRGIGTAVKSDGEVIGAIAMSGPVNRLRGDRYWDELPDQLARIQRTIEVKATYQ
ncbi:IclR family transcriptional regulator [Halococcus sp. IIIV-5B]|uniref:IclR family transcriptional regulator n=1 Tax=Halococcus sp. IIIV-5B TaxID=2321230 RepID=UPI0013143268|nr:IclR family transcriptional regulator [Halococcus sp. IIIV-5B]